MGKRRAFEPAFKARVVLDVLTRVKSAAELCRQHRLKSQLISPWKREFVEPLSAPPDPPRGPSVPDNLRKDLGILLVFLTLAVLFFWPVTLGGKTMLPADNAFAWEPWKSHAQEAGVTTPQNGLLSDLYLENYVWKRFLR